MDDDVPNGPRLLRRIADTLDVSLDELFHYGLRSGPPSSPRAEVRALIRAFSRVNDPGTRDLLIRMVEDAARVERSAVDPAG